MKMWDAAELVRRMKMITSDEQLNEVYQTWPKDERDFLEHMMQEDNPALVVDGKVVSYGKVLKKDEAKALIQKVRT